MKEIRSRSEIEAHERDLSRETDERLENEQEEARQLEGARQAFENLNEPRTTDGAERMNAVIDATRSKGTERIETAHRDVEEGVETEKNDVSEPSDKAADESLLDAGMLEGSAMMNDRCRDDFLEGMGERDDESRFFSEVSDRSKDHQETDKREAESAVQDARNALNSLRHF